MMDEQYYLGLLRQKDDEIRSLQRKLFDLDQENSGLRKTKTAIQEVNKALVQSESSWRELANKRQSEIVELRKERNHQKHEVNSKKNIIEGWEAQYLAMKSSQEALQLAYNEMEKDRDSWRKCADAAMLGWA